MGGPRVRGRVGAAVSHLPGVAFALLLWLVSVAPLSALEVLRVEGSEIGCTYLLRGEITEGSTAHVRHELLLAGEALQKIEGLSYLFVEGRICFDSHGGSFLEGVLLARLLNGASTGVDAGHRCESACFLAFMAGSFERQEDPPVVPDRVMHPRATLGFHAPGIMFENRRFLRDEVSLAWKLALESVAELLLLRMDVQDYDFRDELLEAMIRTDPGDMKFIETVGEAALYNITVFPVVLPFQDKLSRQEAVTAADPAFSLVCHALSALSDNVQMHNAPTGSSLRLNDVDRVTYTAHFDPELSNTTCTLEYLFYGANMEHISLGTAQGWSLGWMSARDWRGSVQNVELAAYMHYPAVTRIVDLPISLDHAAQNAAMIEHLRDSVDHLRCGLSGAARVLDVQNYATIRAVPNFEAHVIAQAPRASLLRPITPGSFRAAGHCEAMCTAASDLIGDLNLVRDCITRNRVWVEVEDQFGNRGWVSRRFLHETE